MQNAVTADLVPFDASSWKIGLVVGQFNQHITEKLAQSALDRAAEYGLAESAITVLPVAGAVEIPLVLQELASSGKYDALMAVACVIRGATPHFDYVCKLVTEGILKVMLEQKTPVAMGVITCNTEEEAVARTSLGAGHLDAIMHQAKTIKELRAGR